MTAKERPHHAGDHPEFPSRRPPTKMFSPRCARTAMSSIIYEVLDMGTGILDARGRLASSGAGIPAFIGVLDKAVQVLVAKFDKPGDIEPGDVFVTNDPLLWRRNPSERHRRRHAGLRRRPPDRLDRQQSPIIPDVGGKSPRLAFSGCHRDLPGGGTAPARRQDDLGAASPSKPGLRHHQDQFAHAGLSRRAICGQPSPRVRIGAGGWRKIAHLNTASIHFGNAMGFPQWNSVRRVSLAELAKLRPPVPTLTSSPHFPLTPYGTFELTEEQDDGRFYNVKITISDTGNSSSILREQSQSRTPAPTNTSRDGVMVCAGVAKKNQMILQIPDRSLFAGQ